MGAHKPSRHLGPGIQRPEGQLALCTDWQHKTPWPWKTDIRGLGHRARGQPERSGGLLREDPLVEKRKGRDRRWVEWDLGKFLGESPL